MKSTPPDIKKRISKRDFPSVFQAWNVADNLPDEDPLTTAARHDLLFHAPEALGLKWNQKAVGLGTGFTNSSIQTALSNRRMGLAKNSNMLLLAEIRYRDAPSDYLPEDHEWWQRKANGDRVPGWEEGGYYKLDFASEEFQEQVATQAQAAVESGVFDGVMLDWWEDDEAHLQLVRRVREAIGDDALILVNPNDEITPFTARYINGYFMECYRSKTVADWEKIGNTLSWAEKNLKSPRINCLETWFHKSRQDLNLMRATTTLALTRSDGYCLFSDPNPLPTPDHLHDWYAFWDKSLGQAKGKGKENSDGAWVREFDEGTVAYNPLGNGPVTISFKKDRVSKATGLVGRKHIVPENDGDLFLVPLK